MFFQAFTVDQNIIHKYHNEFPDIGAKIGFIAHWKVAGALVTSKGITLNWYWSLLVLIAVFASSYYTIMIYW
jgi:hypothetical protein